MKLVDELAHIRAWLDDADVLRGLAPAWGICPDCKAQMVITGIVGVLCHDGSQRVGYLFFCEACDAKHIRHFRLYPPDLETLRDAMPGDPAGSGV